MIAAIRNNIKETMRLIFFGDIAGVKRWPFETNKSYRKRLLFAYEKPTGG